MSAQSSLTIADSWWVRVGCNAPGAPAQSRIVQSNDRFDISLNTTVSPGQTIDCRVCFEPILNGSAMGRDLTGDYPECSDFSYTAPKECNCFVMPTNPGQGADLEETSSRTEKGAPCEGYSEFFDTALGLLTITGPDAGGAYTAEGTPPDPSAYCTGCSGTKTREDLCGCGNPPIREEYDGTGDPSYTDWSPPEDSVCEGTPFEQRRQLAEGSCRACSDLDRGPNPAVGTMLPDWTEWHPRTDLSQVCSDAPGITQDRYDRNGCADEEYEEQTVYGTKNCDCECPPGWLDAMPSSDVVTGEPCPGGELQTAEGSGDNPCETCYKCECPVVGWYPDESEVCEGYTFTQTGYGDCTRTRQSVGMMAPSWQGGTCDNPVQHDVRGCQPDRTLEPPPCCSEPGGCCAWRIIETAYDRTYESGSAGTLPPNEWTPPYHDYEGYMELQRNCGNGWTTEQQWVTENGGPTHFCDRTDIEVPCASR